jgi:hypothetical protein
MTEPTTDMPPDTIDFMQSRDLPRVWDWAIDLALHPRRDPIFGIFLGFRIHRFVLWALSVLSSPCPNCGCPAHIAVEERKDRPVPGPTKEPAKEPAE